MLTHIYHYAKLNENIEIASDCTGGPCIEIINLLTELIQSWLEEIGNGNLTTDGYAIVYPIRQMTIQRSLSGPTLLYICTKFLLPN